MYDLSIITSQTPGIVSFPNFEEVKANLQEYVDSKFSLVDYTAEGLSAAQSDRDELKKMRDAVTKTEKELKEAYSAPYVPIEKMLEELVAIIDAPYKTAKDYAEKAEKEQKEQDIRSYALRQASAYGEVGRKIAESPAFFKKDWLLKKYSVKKYQDEIDSALRQTVNDVSTIQSVGGDKVPVLLAHFYETLSMDKVKSFLATLEDEQTADEQVEMTSASNVIGYKVLKVTATEDQMAGIMDHLELMGVEVEEIEDGMPKPMEELTVPDFDSFVAFDIETTGSFGAAGGDGEAQITEIGAVRVINGEVVDRFDELADPGRSITPMIARLTHITNEMVAGKPPVSEVIRKFYDFVGDSTLVGHNIKNSDLRYIVKAADKAGIHFSVPFLDTYPLAKQFKDERGWEKVALGYLANYYGFEHKEVHRAWSDAEVNAQVYFELQKLFEKKSI